MIASLSSGVGLVVVCSSEGKVVGAVVGALVGFVVGFVVGLVVGLVVGFVVGKVTGIFVVVVTFSVVVGFVVVVVVSSFFVVVVDCTVVVVVVVVCVGFASSSQPAKTDITETSITAHIKTVKILFIFVTPLLFYIPYQFANSTDW